MQHAEATIKGFRLQRHIDGATSIPAKFLTTDDERKGSINAAFENYEQQDNLLKSWLLESMDSQFKIRMVGCEWSHQIWHALKVYFASQTRARVKQLKVQLRNIKKTGSIAEYLVQVKQIVETLAAIGSPLSVEDHIDAIFDGLDENYDGFITSCITRTEAYTVAEIEALLMHQEERLERHKKRETLTPQANIAQSQPKKGNLVTNRWRGRGENRGRGRSGRSNQHSFGGGRGQRIQCQLCGKLGHSAYHCWSRFDENLPDPKTTQHNTSDAVIQEPLHQAMTATSATQSSLDETWYPDTGASNHFTSNLSNLMIKTPFVGTEKVVVGNGNCLPIHNIGTSKLKNPSNNIAFTLNKLLHVPDITKNLLSVAQFAKENSCFFEFHSTDCFVKSQGSRKILLQGKLKNGLYAFENLQIVHPNNDFPVSALYSSTTCNSLPIWHSRLGHCANKIVKHVLKQCNISVPLHDNATVCGSCCLGKMHKSSFSISESVYTEPLQLVYSDIWGPSPIPSKEGYRYYIVFLDAYSKFSWVYFLKYRSQALNSFLEFKKMVVTISKEIENSPN
uniref:Retrovirus-related Pol polyprotein from transposon TNT 1-94 n=1 Tax=Cajanus cajan TaxID=3821 RepID=A0A151THS1_CAJCA|nr:Retrovirus-related Pol polyprotein from transposon TNT 1-94 [Cajanus cajan]